MLAAAGDRDLWVVGGGDVASQFADAGLLNDVIVTIVPVVPVKASRCSIAGFRPGLYS